MTINARGDVAGYYSLCDIGPEYAFVWTCESGLTTLPFPPGTTQRRATDINDEGLVAGWYTIAGDSFGHLGFLHDGQSVITFSPPSGGDWVDAHALNNSAQVVGWWGNTIQGNPAKSAALWQDGAMTDLGGILGSPGSFAYDINNNGLVTGWMGIGRNLATAFMFDTHAGTWLDLGPIPGGHTSEGRAINDRGDVVGKGRIRDPDWPNAMWRPFLWSDGEMLDLGTLPEYERCFALGVNNAREVVGYCDNVVKGGGTAFVWRDGAMTDLNSLVPDKGYLYIAVAWDINDSGQIAGEGRGPNGESAAFLLTPVPTRIGDIDHDCYVGIRDLLALLAGWGSCEPAGACAADLNGDGSVGDADLVLLLGNWG